MQYYFKLMYDLRSDKLWGVFVFGDIKAGYKELRFIEIIAEYFL